MISEQDVLDALDALGDTADEVAESLQRMGFRGTKGTCGACPVMGYLGRRFGSQFICGSEGDYSSGIVAFSRSGSSPDDIVGVELPRPVLTFMWDFDSGLYPALEELAA